MKDSQADSSSSSCEGDAIKVFLRVRPPENANSALPFNGRVVDVNASNNSVTLLAKPDPKVFTFDHVADTNSTQESVFSAVGKSLIESCVAGYNGTIFAYGQTGSGKTFTMLGPSEESDNFKHELRGVIPRSFEHLFNLITREHELHGERKQFLCKCSFLEIYQEQVYDLLDPAAANLQLRENIKKGVFVDGLVEQVVATPTEAYQALSTGWLNRRVAATSMNRESSRSHAVFTMCIESKEEKNGVKNVRQSQLNLVDLAGSERQKDTNTLGIRLKEAGKINQSLSVLGNVIMSLVKIAQGRSQHIPYRDSKLTFLLRDSLGGNAMTSIVACVHPDAKCFGETLSTLNFAKRAKQIKNKAVINEDTQGNVAHLQTEIRRLRDMLSQFQSGKISHPIPFNTAGGDGNAGKMPLDVTEWRNKFHEAMLFREKSEQEKEVLRQLLSAFEEEVKKKDRVIQSSRLIIKFRESTISKLEKNAKNAGTEPAEDYANCKLSEDVASLKTHLEQYPQIAQLDQQLHSLRAQLADARIRLSNTTATLLDSNRLAELEQAFRDLQAANHRESAVGSPHQGENRSSASLQKLREKVAALEEENQQLKKQGTEEKQSWESKMAGLQAELTATKQMNTELQRLLEANHLKHRIQHDALTHLHCQTIKGLTPTRDSYDLRTRTVICGAVNKDPDLDLDQSVEAENGVEDICNEAPPPSMMDNTHEVLTEEIQSLQQMNSSLQERINEYEADMLHLRQQLKQLELEKSSLSEMLSKERSESGKQNEEQEKSLRELRSAVESLTSDLKYAREEVQDYQLLLQSSDKELKAEKNKTKTHSSITDEKINSLETQLLQVQSVVETLGRQLEEETKEREVMEEKLEMERMEKVFLEEQTQTMEQALLHKSQQLLAAQAKLQEVETHLAAQKEEQRRLQERSQEFGKQQEEQLVEASQLKQCLEDVNKDCAEKRSQLDAMATELEASKLTISELRRNVSDNQEALQQQVQRVQELRTKLQESEDRGIILQDLADSRSAEAADAKQQCDTLLAQLEAKTVEVEAAAVQKEMLNEDLAFYQEQNEKNVQECESLRQNIDSLEEEKETLQKETQSLKAELIEREGRLLLISQHLEELRTQQASSPHASPEKSVEHNTVHENKLAAMVEELTKGREQWMSENQQLKGELAALRLEVSQKEALSKKCEELQCQLDNQDTVFKESIRQMQEVNDVERSEAQMLRESLSEAQRQQEAAMHDKNLLLSQFEEAQAERLHAEEEMNRLKAVVEKCYMEKDQLASQIEELKEECKKTKEKLAESDQRSQELADFNAVLAGHANHHQKVMYMKKIQTDYNTIKEKYDEVAKENLALRLRLPPSPLRDRTNAPPLTPRTDAESKKCLPV